MLNKNKIEEIINKIKKKSGVKKIYIFGSFAYGNPNEKSDLDILVLKKNIHNRIKEIIDIEKDIISSKYSIDLLLYTEEEFYRKKKEGWKVFEDIETKGILINV